MTLWLTPTLARQIAEHAREGAPNEVCGVLGGDADGRVRTAIGVTNRHPQPTTHYELDRREMVQALMGLQRQGETLLGFYHSHPAGAPIPSPTDVQQATYPEAAYLIVGLRGGQDASFAAWQLRPPEVTRLALYIGEHAPQPSATADPPLTPAQQAAVVIAALIAGAIVIAGSIYL